MSNVMLPGGPGKVAQLATPLLLNASHAARLRSNLCGSGCPCVGRDAAIASMDPAQGAEAIRYIMISYHGAGLAPDTCNQTIVDFDGLFPFLHALETMKR